MNLFLISNDSTVSKVLQLPEYVPGRDLVVCVNYLTYLRFKKEPGAHHFKFIEDVLTPQDYQILHSKTDQFACDWYRTNGIDTTIFNGISFGELVQITFSRTYNLSIKIKYAEATRKLIEQLGNVKVLYHDFLDSIESIYGVLNMPEVLQMIAKYMGLETKRLKPGTVIPDPMFIVHILHKNKQKRLFLKLKLLPKYLINGISSIRQSLNPKEKVYLFDYPNIDNLLNYYPHQLVITDLNKRLMRWPLIFSGLKFFQFEEVQYDLSEQERQFLVLLNKKFLLQGDNVQFGCDFKINGFDYTNIYKPVIEELISQMIPELLKYAGQLRKGVRQAHIKAILMRDCLSEKCRVIVEVCKQVKVRTIFIDHGIICLSHAQRVADWSSPDEVITTLASYNPYKFQSKLVELGNPCMDPYPASKRKKVTSIKKVLFLSFEENHYARLDRFSYQEKYYEQVFSSFGELLSAGIEIFFRPHSLDKDYFEYLFTFFGVDPSRINFGRQGSFTDAIYEMDLLVANVSTCFFEAQAAGIPAIMMEPHYIKEALVAPFNGIHGQEVLRVSTKEELVKLILSNQHDPAYLNMFLSNFLSQHAPLYMGTLDGMSSKRIMEYVCKKATV